MDSVSEVDSRLLLARVLAGFGGLAHRCSAVGTEHPKLDASVHLAGQTPLCHSHVCTTTTATTTTTTKAFGSKRLNSSVDRSVPDTNGSPCRTCWRATPAQVVATRGAERRGCPRHSPSPQRWFWDGDATREEQQKEVELETHAGPRARTTPPSGRGRHLCLRSPGRKRQSRSVTWLPRLPRWSWRLWRCTTRFFQ